MGVDYTLPPDLGEQLVHVTLKGGENDQRIERQVITISGEGAVDVTFQIPLTVKDTQVRFAAFVGKDFPHHLQYLVADPQRVN